MGSIVLIGDVHNRVNDLQRIVEEHKGADAIIQLGDFLFQVEEVPTLPDNFYCVRGNHCNPSYYKGWRHYLGDYGYNEELDIFFVSGAWSIDWQWRTAGVSWWYDEELSQAKLEDMLKLYEEVKPEYVISHDCPLSVYPSLPLSLSGGQIMENRTNVALERAFKIHQPKRWFYGHHHAPVTTQIGRTTFRCVDELEVVELIR